MVRRIVLTFASICIPVMATAQPLGTYRWQLQPYCNVISVAVTQNGSTYRIEGTDDQCGAARQGSALGMAFLNPDGTIGFGLMIVAAPGAAPVHVDATIPYPTLTGTWRDSLGHTGTFAFTAAAGTGGAPLPTSAPATFGSVLTQPASGGDRGLSAVVNADTGSLLGDSHALYGQWGAFSGFNSPGRSGVRGDSQADVGVVGTSMSGVGVRGWSAVNVGVEGFALTGIGVRASTSAGTTALEIDNGSLRVTVR
ncbi:MAG: hypothetical protein LC791_07085 [Acidobacteria bacterium]|nr:hypothetical protein [Acidobacteriota bacterium]